MRNGSVCCRPRSLNFPVLDRLTTPGSGWQLQTNHYSAAANCMHFEVFNPTEERKSIALITLSSHFIGGGAGSSITAYRHRDAAGAGPARVAAGGGGRGGRQLKGEIYNMVTRTHSGGVIVAGAAAAAAIAIPPSLPPPTPAGAPGARFCVSFGE